MCHVTLVTSVSRLRGVLFIALNWLGVRPVGILEKLTYTNWKGKVWGDTAGERIRRYHNNLTNTQTCSQDTPAVQGVADSTNFNKAQELKKWKIGLGKAVWVTGKNVTNACIASVASQLLGALRVRHKITRWIYHIYMASPNVSPTCYVLTGSGTSFALVGSGKPQRTENMDKKESCPLTGSPNVKTRILAMRNSRKAKCITAQWWGCKRNRPNGKRLANPREHL